MTVSDEADALNGYTAELLLGGTVVDTFDSEVPDAISLSTTPGTTVLGVRVRDRRRHAREPHRLGHHPPHRASGLRSRCSLRLKSSVAGSSRSASLRPAAARIASIVYGFDGQTQTVNRSTTRSDSHRAPSSVPRPIG